MLESHMARAVLAVLTLSACPMSFAAVAGSEPTALIPIEFRLDRELPADARFHPDARIMLASADDMPPLLAPMLALYSQLLSLDGNGSGGTVGSAAATKKKMKVAEWFTRKPR